MLGISLPNCATECTLHVATIPSGSKYNDGLSNSVRDKMKPIFRIVSDSDRVDQLEEDSSA